MQVRDIFASNLRRLCETRGSINFVCRQLGIHRQQFALYLRGDRLPNKRTMDRLSRYFRVPEDAFFADPATRVAAAPDPCDAVFERATESPPAMAEGLYQTYFWSPALGNDVVGATTAVRRKDKLLTFRRLTAAAERLDPTWSYVKGDHQGVVTERMGWLYFHGSNQIEPREPTLLALKWAALSGSLLAGHAMATSHLGPMVLNVVMVPLPASVSLISAIRSSRAFSLDDPKIGLIARFLKQPVLY